MKKVIALLLFILAVLSVIIYVLGFIKKPAPSRFEPPIIYNPTVLPTQPTLKSRVSPYLKTLPGKTSEQEVLVLKNFKTKNVLPNNSTEYLFHSPRGSLRDDIVIIQNSVVIFERAITVDKTTRKHPAISDFIKLYGNPEKELQGSDHYGEFEKTYIFSSKGFTIIGNPFTDEVDEIQIYLPITTDQYISLWGSDIKPYSGHGEKLAE